MVGKNASPEAVRAAVEAENYAKCYEPLEDKEIDELLKSAEKYRSRNQERNSIEDSKSEVVGEDTKKALSSFVISYSELMEMEISDRENIIMSWLAAQSICLIFALRGLGKTWFCLALAVAVALGQKFFAWGVPKPRPVLYVDGEMTTKMLKDRLKSLCNGLIPNNLYILPSELLWKDGAQINLSKEADQRRINIMLDDMTAAGHAPELIIFDNLSSMRSGVDENSNSDLDGILKFFVSLRHKGYAVLIVHCQPPGLFSSAVAKFIFQFSDQRASC